MNPNKKIKLDIKIHEKKIIHRICIKAEHAVYYLLNLKKAEYLTCNKPTYLKKNDYVIMSCNKMNEKEIQNEINNIKHYVKKQNVINLQKQYKELINLEFKDIKDSNFLTVLKIILTQICE